MAGRNQDQNSQKKYIKESDLNVNAVEAALDQIRSQYDKIGQQHGLSSDVEFEFLWSIFTSNTSLLQKACEEPKQLKRALLTQAGVGLTLDPSKQLSYLVVRKYKLIYDVGYRGLIKIAVDDGLIESAKPELVYRNDTFEYRGMHEEPIHTSQDFFGDRGPVVGAYLITTLPSGKILVETMTESEFMEISALNPNSDAWKNEHSKGEMRKKTILKRGSKWWYNSAATGKSVERLANMINYLNEEAGEGIDLQKNKTESSSQSAAPEEQSPEPAPILADEEVPEKASNFAFKVVDRAKKANAFKVGEEYLKEKFHDEKLLAWALEKLRLAKEEVEQAENGSEQEPPPPTAQPEQPAAQTAG